MISTVGSYGPTRRVRGDGRRAREGGAIASRSGPAIGDDIVPNLLPWSCGGLVILLVAMKKSPLEAVEVFASGLALLAFLMVGLRAYSNAGESFHGGSGRVCTMSRSRVFLGTRRIPTAEELRAGHATSLKGTVTTMTSLVIGKVH